MSRAEAQRTPDLAPGIEVCHDYPMTTNASALAHSLPVHGTTTVTAFAPVAGFSLVIDVVRDTITAARREASTPGPDKAGRILKALHVEKAEMPRNERRM